MNLLDLKNIDLGLDPVTGYQLKGDLIDFYFAPNFTTKGDSTIRIRVKVTYFDGVNEVFSNRFLPYEKQHFSENSVMVDETGHVDDNGTIGETDFFIMYVENTNIDFFGAIYSKIIEARDRGVYYL